MSDIIHLLPDSVANQIAAGEVIQRPASVIKELMENAVDAEAKHIDVVVVDAGKTTIQVVDDGKGMSETDARLSFERHATSKIREAADLFALVTMGFRGEALASIAAVAQVELRTRLRGEELGTQVSVSGSQITGQEIVSCPVGCNFCVNNLFFNVPARRKFLKSNQTEMTNILQEFERVVLVNPDVNFSLAHGDVVLMNLPASPLRRRIVHVFGKKFDEQLLPVEVDTTLVRITGFVGKPESARKKGYRQYLFVNNRYMRHAYFHKAVMEAYEQLIPVGEQVSYFLYFDVDPANIDVNIHPTKTEIKFENEPAIWQIIVAAVKEALGRFNAVPTIEFDTEGRPDIPVFSSSQLSAEVPETHYNPDFNPFRSSAIPEQTCRHSAVDWDKLYSGLPVAAGSVETEEYNLSLPDEPENQTLYADVDPMADKSTLHYQYKGRYILTSVKSGLMIVDQNRAHIRILYDKYRKQMQGKNGLQQGLLFPEMVQFPMSEAIVLDEIMEDMVALGFDIASLGGGSYSINAIPAGTEGLSPVNLIQNMVHNALEKEHTVGEEVRHLLALSLAKSAAIVAGQMLTNEEMDNLITELFACESPNYTPDGKVVIAILEKTELENLFN